jgi:phosphoglycolate phosphatase
MSDVTIALPESVAALLFDFDGVIVESAALKTSAYSTVYAGEDPAALAEVLDYQRRHGGLGRYEKFAHFEHAVFGRAADAAAIDRLAAAYHNVVFEAVLACPFVAGAQEFLRFALGRVDMHLISGTPQDELVDIVERRRLSRYFASVHGAPTSKRAAFERILVENGYAAAATVAVGDATTEFVAAQELGIHFVGIVAPGSASPFPAAVPTLANLEQLGVALRMR